MRLLHVTDAVPGWAEGGREVYIRDFCDLSTRAGWSNRVVTVDEVPAAAAAGRGLDVAGGPPEVIVAHTRRAWALAGQLKTVAPCVGWAHSQGVICPGGMTWHPTTGEACDIQVSMRCLSSAYLRQCAPRRPRQLAQAWSTARQASGAVDHLSAVLVGSRYMKGRLEQAGFSSTKVSTAAYFHEWSHALPGGSGQYDPPSGDPVVLCVSRLHESKGVHVLIEALRHVQSPCRVVIEGTGLPEYERRLRQAAARVERGGRRVEFVGRVPDRLALSRLYRSAALLVVPSAWPEAFALVGIEAMAFGRPVVAFDVGGISEWLSDHEVGLLARPGDEADLASKIDALLADPTLRSELGAAASRRVLQQFSWPAHFRRFQAVLEKHAIT